MKKKCIALLLSLALALFLAACGSDAANSESQNTQEEQTEFQSQTAFFENTESESTESIAFPVIGNPNSSEETESEETESEEESEEEEEESKPGSSSSGANRTPSASESQTPAETPSSQAQEPAATSPEPETPAAETPAVEAASLTSNETIAQEVLDNTNALRASLGIGSLSRNATLDRIALLRAQDMIENDYFDHYKDGVAQYTLVAEQVGYSYTWLGENLYWQSGGSCTGYDMYNGWYNSPGHYANMVSTNYGQIGIACVQAPDGSWYGVQIFSN